MRSRSRMLRLKNSESGPYLASRIDLSALRILEAKIFFAAPPVHWIGCVFFIRYSSALPDTSVARWRDRMSAAFLAIAGVSAAGSLDWSHGRLVFFGLWGDLDIGGASNSALLVVAICTAIGIGGLLFWLSQWSIKFRIRSEPRPS